MKKILILGMIALLLISFSTFAFAAAAQDFTLTNQTGVDIHYIYVSPHSSNKWGSDIMGKDHFPAGSSVHVFFSPTENVALWDIKVVDWNGNSLYWENFNLKLIHEIVLKKGGIAETH